MKAKFHSGSFGTINQTELDAARFLYFCLFEKIGPTSLLALDKNYFYYKPCDKLSVVVLEDEPVEIDTIEVGKVHKSTYASVKSNYWKVFLCDSFGHKTTGYMEEGLLNAKLTFF